MCDVNVEVFLSCIEAASKQKDGFAAIKMTALGKPELLMHLSDVIAATKHMFVAFLHESRQLQQPASASALATRGPQGDDVDAEITFEQFRLGLSSISVNLPEDKVRRLYDRFDVDHSGSISLLDWLSFLDPRLLGGLKPKFQSQGLPTLSDDELHKLDNMLSRLERITEAAARLGVRLMIDAEQTYFQPAIDLCVLHLQRKYNRDRAIVFNTYQCYLRDSFDRVNIDLKRAVREKFCFGAKIVRGAYMVQERARAASMSYSDPIQPQIQATHDKSAFSTHNHVSFSHLPRSLQLP